MNGKWANRARVIVGIILYCFSRREMVLSDISFGEILLIFAF
jgi:hypothetical protein